MYIEGMEEMPRLLRRSLLLLSMTNVSEELADHCIYSYMYVIEVTLTEIANSFPYCFPSRSVYRCKKAIMCTVKHKFLFMAPETKPYDNNVSMWDPNMQFKS
jgi:hypothetical protein